MSIAAGCFLGVLIGLAICIADLKEIEEN